MDTQSNAEAGKKEKGGNAAQASRIIARFQPQAWINDYAVEIDGAYDFDVTDQVLALGREKALELEDSSYETDGLWQDNPISEERPHTGPFAVYVEDAIRDYFEALDRDDEDRHELKLPVKLNDDYTCQGTDADGSTVVFEDLLQEGEKVATLTVGDDHFGPFGVVVKRDDGLWIVLDDAAAR